MSWKSKTFLPYNTFLSGRGAFLTLLAAWCVLILSEGSSDIVAGATGLFLLFLLLAMLTLTSIQAYLSERKMSLAVTLEPLQERTPHSYRKREALVRLRGLTLWPLHQLEGEFIFQQPMKAPHLLFTSSHHESLTTRLTISFPHRGDWRLEQVQFTLRDKLGLTSFRWKKRYALDCPIYPAQIPPLRLPVISSSARSGDTIPTVFQHQGDPYDIKRYHPSDGMRKILWKMYAKSGELMSRHPERSLTPEGQVFIYVIAGARDDHVCAAALAYARYLEELNLEIFFGCLGHKEQAFVQTSDEAQNILTNSVWYSDRSTPKDLAREIKQYFIGQPKSLFKNTLQIVTFLSKHSPDLQKSIDTLERYGRQLEHLSATPSFMLIEDPLQKTFEQNTQDTFASLFFDAPTPQRGGGEDLSLPAGKLCATRQWSIRT